MTTKSIRASSRKDAHIDLALNPETNSEGKNSFDRMSFRHCALPELDIAAIDITTSFCNQRLSAPMMIGAMTGGTARAEAINRALATVAQEKKIAFAVGSQRAALEWAERGLSARPCTRYSNYWQSWRHSIGPIYRT